MMLSCFQFITAACIKASVDAISQAEKPSGKARSLNTDPADWGYLALESACRMQQNSCPGRANLAQMGMGASKRALPLQALFSVILQTASQPCT